MNKARCRNAQLLMLSLSAFLLIMCIVIPHPQSMTNYTSVENNEKFETDSSSMNCDRFRLADDMIAVTPTAPLWSHIYDVHSTDWGEAITKCSDGSFAVAGTSYGLEGFTGDDFFLMKTNDTGQEEWTKGYGIAPDDWCNSVIECSDGGFALAGRTESYGAGDFDIWLVKTDSSGNWLWNRTFGGTGSEYGYAVTECLDGNLTIVGSTNSFGSGGYDAWVIYANSTGHHLWNKTLGGVNGDGANDVIQSSDGNITIVGNTYSYGGADNDLWLIHLDIDGTHLWNKTIGGDAYDTGNSLVETSDGGYAITGETRSYNGGASHYDDVWIVRTNSSGDMIWYTAFPNIGYDDAEGIVESVFGGFAVTGTIRDPGSTDRDLGVIRFDDDGNQLWNWTYGDSYDNFGRDIIELDDSGFAVAGITDTDGWDKDVFLVGVPDTPFWTELPEDSGLEYDTHFNYDLNATLPHGLSDWWINDTSNFVIDQDGKVSNITNLPLGNYGIEVSVNDSLDYVLEGEFTLSIVDTTDPTWDEPAAARLIELGNKFSYNLNASDTFGIHHYWINDTVQFTIDGSGIIANVSMIPVGEHGISVR
ncbi:MAG: hypothetical protein ACW98Y_14510, partial [Candidatus Thorarchaeota archaeon]